MSNKVSRLTSILIGIVLIILSISGWFLVHNQNKGGLRVGTVDDCAVKCSELATNTNGLVYIDDPIIPLSNTVGNLYTAQLAGDTLSRVNEIRKRNGLHPLVWDENLMMAAYIRAEECSRVWSHTRPNGLPFNTVDAKHVFGENLAFGYNSASEALGGWMASASHKANILDKDFTKTAIAIYCDDDGVFYWAQEFGW